MHAYASIARAGLDRVFFATTGAEAVENAIKLARQATGKPNVIVFKGSYHGRSLGTCAPADQQQPAMRRVHGAKKASFQLGEGGGGLRGRVLTGAAAVLIGHADIRYDAIDDL